MRISCRSWLQAGLVMGLLMSGRSGEIRAQGTTIENTQAVRQFIGWTFVRNCFNAKEYRACCRPCEECAVEPLYEFRAAGSKGNCIYALVPNPSNSSFIDNVSFNLHHYAMDYRPAVGSGCNSCSGGSSKPELPSLVIQRRHRYRDMTEPGSFGPGVFCNYDAKLHLYAPSTIDLFDPADLFTRRVVDGLDGDTKNGIYTDRQSRTVKEIRLLKADGTLTSDQAQAVTAEMRNWYGALCRFQLINTVDGQGAWTAGRVNGAYAFYGTGEKVVVPDNDALDGVNRLSLTFWVKPMVLDGSAAGVISKRVSHADNNAYGVFFHTGKKLFVDIDGMNDRFSSNRVFSAKQWYHVAVVFDGTLPQAERVKLYVNGALDKTAAETSTAIPASTADLLLGQLGGGSVALNALLDEVRVYRAALSAADVQGMYTTPGSGPLQDLQAHWQFDDAEGTAVADATGHGHNGSSTRSGRRDGRLVRIEDRNGHGVSLTYKTWTPEQLAEAPDRQWQIDTVADAYGRTATFSYHPEQVSGRWSVSRIDLPNGQKVEYDYADGRISQVRHDDGTQSTFTYGTDADSQTTTVTISDAAADGTHRSKTAYLTNNIVEIDGQVYNQPSLLARMVVNASGEVTYLSVSDPTPNTWLSLVYEGAGRVKELVHNRRARFYQDGWTFNPGPQGYTSFAGQFEPTFDEIPYTGDTDHRLQIPPYVTDAQGVRRDLLYDGDGFNTQATFTDGTTEKTTYNAFKQVTRQQDRMYRVTKFSYDAKGNMLTKEVGILYDPNTQQDVNQPEYAIYRWEYYGAGEVVDGVTQPMGLLKYAFDASGNRTQHVYNAQKLLWKVGEAEDEGEGYHVAQTFTYDAAGRLQTSADALGRTATYAYDVRDRQVRVTYHDNSTAETLYGTDAEANLVIARKDRNGSVTIYRHDGVGRQTEVAAAASNVGPQGTILAGYTRPQAQVYLPEAAVTTTTYLNGTALPLTVTSRGEMTSYVYDYRHRAVQTIIQPQSGRTLVSKRTYRNNRLFSTEDPYGRKRFSAYRSTDGALLRSIQGTVPQFALADFAAVLNQPRDLNPNATYLVTDNLPNAAGEQVETIDPRGISTKTTFDSRGRAIEQVAAFGTPVAAKTQTIYDADGNVLEVRSPRYFDANDARGFQKTCETWTYTRRDLKKTHSVAAGDAAYPQGTKVTESWTYNLDRTAATHTDFRGNIWETLWSPCCAGRVTAQSDPLSAANTSDYDAFGNVTHTQRIHGATVFSQSTTRYDARHRPTARTAWLVLQANVNPKNPPIAGGGQPGDPDAHDGQGNTVGLTTRYLYDENLTDGVGLDSAQGVSVPRLKAAGNMNVSIAALLSEMNADLGGGQAILAAGCDGSATVVVNPEDEISVSIQDGAGRTIATGIIRQDGTPIAWRCAKHDAVVNLAGYGDVLETAQIDALDHIIKTRTDGAGRAIQSLDALGKITAMKYDAAGNTLCVRDPNNVGWDAGSALGTFDGYDPLNRLVARIDTQGDKSASAFDAHGNVVRTTDAKNQQTSFVFDARDRRASMTDRLGGLTTWKYDENGNLLELCDADNQGPPQKATVWTYDVRNLKVTEAYPGHNPASQIGDADYDKKLFGYDLAGRPDLFTDQQGDTVRHGFDMANRIVRRDYRTRDNSPDGQIADSDTFAFDDAGRIRSATSGRYNNTVSLAYTDGAGRLTGESLTVNFGQERTYSVQSQYDAANRRTQITYPDGSVVARGYTARDQLEQVGYNGNVAASFAYDDGGRRTTRILGDTPGTVTTWSYVGRNDNLIMGISDNRGIVSFAYTYDPNKNKLTETIGGATQQYGFTVPAGGYDAEDRLVGWNRDDGQKNQSWSLSLAGDWNTFTENAVAQTRAHNNVHELTAIDQTALAHDAKGNLTTNANAQTYDWDFDNRILSATVGANTHSYTYDALGRRVSKTVMTGGGTGEQTTATLVFVNSIRPLKHSPHAGQELAEYPANAAPASPQRKYIYAEYVDEPVLMLTPGGEAETKHYYHANNLYSVAALSDQAGAVVERYAYTAYGQPLFLDGAGNLLAPQPAVSALANPYLFAGRRLDAESHNIDYRLRTLDTQLGRFLSRDRKWYVRSMSMYAYVDGHPLSMLDPSGNVRVICEGSFLDAGGTFLTLDVKANWTAGTLEQTCEKACQTERWRLNKYRTPHFISSGWTGGWRHERTGIDTTWKPDPNELCKNVDTHSDCQDRIKTMGQGARCCTKQECVACLDHYIKVAEGVEIPDGPDHCVRWVEAYRGTVGKNSPQNCRACIGVTNILFQTDVGTGLGALGWIIGSFERHGAVQISICNGEEFFIDNGWLGGNDNFFAPEEIPGGSHFNYWSGYGIIGPF